MRRIELDLNKIQSEQEIREFFREHMAFPKDYGENMDELYEMLTELSENICVELCLLTNEQGPLYEYSKKLERVMEDVAQTVEYTKDGRMFAVFADFESLDVGGAW